MSALNASVWSGSWFISMKLFGWLRQMEFRYVSIFLITVAMYIVGVAWYAYLIRQYERERQGEHSEGQQTKLEPVEAGNKSL
jgi:nitrate/nitrite transporter NarK